MDSLSKLFGSAALVRMMRLFLFHPDAAYEARGVAEKVKATPASARAGLRQLAAAGLVKQRGAKKFALNLNFPYRRALEELLLRDLLLDVNVARALSKAGRIALAVASGVFIADTESRTDLLIVGSRINEKALAKAVASLEADIGTDIRYAAFLTPEFQYRLSVNDKLVRDILDFPHVVLMDKIKAL